MTNPVFKTIEETLQNNPVTLYMKGSKDFPACGFSALVSHILSQTGVDFYDVDVLRDDEIRQGIKEYGDWPTIPQLYVKGELVGGCDIIKEMHENGELENFSKTKI